MQQLKSLQNELEQRLLFSAVAKKQTGAARTRAVATRIRNESTRNAHAPTAATDAAAAEEAASALAALRASANARMFADECRLSLPIADYRVCDSDRLRYDDIVADDISARRHSGSGSGSSPATDTATSEAEESAVQARVQPLVALKQQIHDMHPPSAPERAPADVAAILHVLQSALDACVTTLRQSYARCHCSTVVLQGMAAWPRGLLRLINETTHREPMTSLTEATVEKLRRIHFDAEELEQEQQQAVGDGDMQRSEALYFQQVTLLESMKPFFDKMEAILTNYRVTQAEKPVEQLRQFQQSFRSSVASAMSKEKAVAQKAQADLAVLTQRRLDVAQRRDAQWAGLQLYREEWNRVFDDNASQQMSCLKAMEELERRLANLAQEQAFLVRDRMTKVRQEAQREADAMAFDCFVGQRTAALAHSLSCSESAMSAMDGLNRAIESSCALFDRYLADGVKADIDAELMRVRTERLEQFRSLYLTLGDLQYKKSRHAEEIAKKIEYYGLQQEIAMDELNPKAKEFSQTKRKWQDVHDEIHSQIHMLESRSQKQLEDFKPTEKLLLEAKVPFKHPRDELQERNMTRTQRLLEYKKLMDDVTEKSPAWGGRNTKEVEGTTSSILEGCTHTSLGLSTISNESHRGGSGADVSQSQISAQATKRCKSPALQSMERCDPRGRPTSSARQSRSGKINK